MYNKSSISNNKGGKMLNILNLIAQTTSRYQDDYGISTTTTTANVSLSPAATLFIFVIYIIAVVLLAIVVWKLYTKAGKPGWASLVPIYSSIVEMEIIGRPAWWFLLYIIPVFGIYVMVLDRIILAKSFGKDGGFAVGLILLPFIFYPILAFGKTAQYQGPMANGTSLSM